MKTPYMMQGYYKLPVENKKFFDFEGFGHSGDLGYYDENGQLHYVDRLKDLIKYNNNHISPGEIESVLQTHPAVQESLVYGKQDIKHQELITACVVLIPGKKVNTSW